MIIGKFRTAVLLAAFSLVLFPVKGEARKQLCTNRLFGTVTIETDRKPEGSVTLLSARNPEAARQCGSKLLADLTGFGWMQPLPGNTTILHLGDTAWFRIGVKGSQIQLLISRSESDLERLAARCGADAWSPVRTGLYPRWFDRFDNDAVAIGFLGWGVLPKDYYEAFDWAKTHFHRFLFSFTQESNYLAPGLWDYSCLDWCREIARRYDVSMDMYLASAQPGRPTWPWNVIPLPHTGMAKNSHFGFHRGMQQVGMRQYSGFFPVKASDDALFASQYLFARHATADPNYGALFALAEPGHIFVPTLSYLAESQEAKTAWRAYLRDTLGYDLKTVGDRHYGDPARFRSWGEVPIPTMRDFAGWDPATCLDLQPLKWEVRPDLHQQGLKERWFEDNSSTGWAGSRPNTPMLAAYVTSWLKRDETVSLWFRCRFRVDARDAGRLAYVHSAQEPMMRSSGILAAYLNGTPLKSMIRNPNDSLTNDRDDCFALGGMLRPGENTLTIQTAGYPLPGYLFLGERGRWSYPAPQKNLNQRYFDAANFIASYQVSFFEKIMKAYRAGAPAGQPLLLMAPSDYLDLLNPLMKKYGAFPHDTGNAGGILAPWVTSYSSLHGIPLSSEPAYTPPTVQGLRKNLTFYLWNGNESVNWLWDPAPYRIKGKAEWLDANRALMNCVGKMEVPEKPIGVLRSIRNASRLRFQEPWHWDVSRGTLQSIGRSGQVVDPADLVSGYAQNRFPMLFDAGTILMTDAEVDALESYVRNGGIYIVLHNTGRHSPNTADSWPISRLTGMKFTRFIADGGIRFRNEQKLWPSLRGKVIRGRGFTADHLKNDTAGSSLGLKVAADNVEVVAEWCDARNRPTGEAAVAVRHLGKGMVVALGSTFWRHARDENGRWISTRETRKYLDELFSSLKIPRASRVTPETLEPEIFLEKRRSKNGLFDLYLVARINTAAQEKTVSADVTFFDAPPTELREISASNAPSVRFQTGRDGQFTIPRVELLPMQLRIFAAPRRELSDLAALWLGSLEKRWQQLSEIDCRTMAPEVQKPSPWILPLVEQWKFEAGTKQGVCSLGTFDGIGLPAESRAIFRKSVTLPAAWKSRRISLVFKAPGMEKLGVWPTGIMRVNGKPVMKFDNPYLAGQHKNVDLEIPQEGKLDLELEIDGHLKPGARRFRPTGVLGMFYLLANPQPASSISLPPWRKAKSFGKLEAIENPAEPGEYLYLETRFATPQNWPKEKLFLEFDRINGFGSFELNEQMIAPAIFDMTGYRQVMVDRLLNPPGRENILRWRPYWPHTARNVILFREAGPAVRLAAWPDLPFAPGE